jgi:2-hydroxycyclohexanecarboxyl-CoA dehydrogenase
VNGLRDRVALVTGGGVGIGRAVALKLAREGAHVAILDIDEAAARKTAEEVRSIGRRAATAVGDVASKAAVESAVATLAKAVGPFDILVNNAGIVRIGPLLTMSEKDWQDTFSINVNGTFNVTRAVVPGMVERKRGAVVNLASWLGRRGQSHFGAYCASKFAIVGMTQSLAFEVAPHVRVNAVGPGLIVGTRMRDEVEVALAGSGLPQADERAKKVPLGRAGTAEDVASIVVFLASDDAAYVTGATYDVTGGIWMT